ncbi:hypothetical protein P9112_001303 [Eukaryota sp. TZLM1-RC]
MKECSLAILVVFSKCSHVHIVQIIKLLNALTKPISSINENSHAQYNLYPFVFSLLVSSGNSAMIFLEDFVVVVEERTGRIFNRVDWQNRIVFSIFKGMLKLTSDPESSFGKFPESFAVENFDAGEAGFEDVDVFIFVID